MIGVAEYREELLARIRPVREVTLPVEQAHGLVLTTDVRSAGDLPRFDNSAMDGYAVRCADVAGADPERPVLVPVAGEVAAGDTEAHAVLPRTCWRIMTGAPVPEGCDAVVPVEDTDGHPREVQIRRAPEPGAHIRRAGEDLRAGDLVLPLGTELGPAQVAAVAASGVRHVTVTGPVRVVVLSTGNELVASGEPVGPGGIVDSNGPMLASAVRAAGHYAVHVGHLADDPDAVRKALKHHLRHADAIITTGGVSKGGEHDTVKAVLSGERRMRFTEVAMRPGKPQGFGVLGTRRVPVFTLPGNPVSALVSFEVFVRPALARRAGRSHHPATGSALVAEGWTSPEGKLEYLAVRLERDVGGSLACRPAGPAGSHRIATFARADALAVVPAGTQEVVVGSTVKLLPLRPLAEVEAELAAEVERKDRLAADLDDDRGSRGRHRWRS